MLNEKLNTENENQAFWPKWSALVWSAVVTCLLLLNWKYIIIIIMSHWGHSKDTCKLHAMEELFWTTTWWNYRRLLAHNWHTYRHTTLYWELGDSDGWFENPLVLPQYRCKEWSVNLPISSTGLASGHPGVTLLPPQHPPVQGLHNPHQSVATHQLGFF